MYKNLANFSQKIIDGIKYVNQRFSLMKLLTGALLIDVSITVALLCFCDVQGLTHKLWAFSGEPTANAKSISKPISKQVSNVDYRKSMVTALGRLEPVGEIVKISVPAVWKDERVEKLLVKQSDHVKAGQVLAVLDGRCRQAAALSEAEEQVRVAEAQLAKVKAGAKRGEIEAQRRTVKSLIAELDGKIVTQRAVIEKLKAELVFAESEYARHKPLYEEGAISASILDSKRMAYERAFAALKEAEAELVRTETTLKERISEAEATLNKVAEVRPVDVELAMREVDAASAKAAKIKTDLELCYVRAPKEGQVLKVHVRAGESVPESKGILDLGTTRQMVAVAEVYQSDVHSMKLGQPATIAVEGVTEAVHGQVWQIGLEVLRQNVFAAQPGANQDRRVVEVKVLIDEKDSAKVCGLSNMQVEVAIATR